MGTNKWKVTMNNQPNNNPNNNQNTNQNNQNSSQNNPNQGQSQPKPVQSQPVQTKNTGPMVPNTNKNFTKIAWVILALVVLAALLGNGKWKKNATPDNTVSTAEVQEGCKPGYLFSETTGKPCVTDDATASVLDAVPTRAPGNSSYDQVLKQYAGKTLAVNASCEANDLSVDSGTRVLVANNSAKTLSLSLGSKTASLRPYHYFTTTLREDGEVDLMCNGDSAGTVTVN